MKTSDNQYHTNVDSLAELNAQQFEYIVNFTLNVFAHESDGDDVPNNYLSFYHKNHTLPHFPNDFRNLSNTPTFTTEAINKYEHVYSIESVHSLTESNPNIVESELTEIVCTGQTSQLSGDFVWVYTL